MNQNLQRENHSGMFGHLREDFLASVVVFLVALPLCIGIAVAVGVNPARALITGIVGGLIVGFFAGSPLQVSGPAAGLFVIVADLIAKGRAQHQAVLQHAIHIFREKFTYFVDNISAMDELFEVSFSSLASSGKPLSR